MFTRTHTLLTVLLVTSLNATAIPAPLGHMTPKYASSRIIYRDTTSNTHNGNLGHDPRSCSHPKDKTDPHHRYSHTVYKRPKLPHHANLDFGDHDEDGPEDLSPNSRLIPTSKPKRIRGRDMEMNYANAPPPQPVRGDYGAPLLGPQNVPLEEQNLDLLSPDLGKVDNFKWPFALSHNRLTKGGWARQQNGELGVCLY